MKIYCPKCKTAYEISAGVVPEQGRRLRCAVCHKVFKCLPEDLIDGSHLRAAEFDEEEKARLDEKGMLIESAEEVNPNIDIKAEIEEEVESTPSLEELDAQNLEANGVTDIFARLSQETEALFKVESEEKTHRKMFGRFKKTLGLQNPRNYKYYILFFLALIGLGLYYARYDVARSVPVMRNVYTALGIQSAVVGEGLEFQNVSRRDFEEDSVRKFEIKGFIANNANHNINIPQIHAILLDKDARQLQVENADSAIPLVVPGGKVAFSFVVSKPALMTKYIYLTFGEIK